MYSSDNAFHSYFGSGKETEHSILYGHDDTEAYKPAAEAIEAAVAYAEDPNNPMNRGYSAISGKDSAWGHAVRGVIKDDSLWGAGHGIAEMLSPSTVMQGAENALDLAAGADLLAMAVGKKSIEAAVLREVEKHPQVAAEAVEVKPHHSPDLHHDHTVVPTHTQPESLLTKHVNKHREVHTELEADHVEETIARAQLRNERRVAQVKLTQHRAELSAFQRARYAAESLRVGYTAANMASDILARKAPQVPEPAQLPKPEREQSPVEEEWNRHQASEVEGGNGNYWLLLVPLALAYYYLRR